MRCWKRLGLEVAVTWWCLAVLTWLPTSLWAQGSGNTVEISALQLTRGAAGVLLSASVHFELPSVVEDALLKGIPMVFVAEAEISRTRWYWADKRVASSARHMRLSFSTLTRRWRLSISTAPNANAGLVGSLNQNFDTLSDAIAAIQRLSRWKIADDADIDPDARHSLSFAFRLDVTQLPRLFQIGALGQTDWLLSARISQPLLFEAEK